MTVGFVGLGRMGGRMCRNIVRKSGQPVVVLDLDADAVAACTALGATAAPTIAELAAASDVIFTSLPRPADVEAVALGPGGIAESAKRGTVYFDLTTNSPAVARRVAAELAKRGITMLDAPVSGSPSGAEAGTLSVMVGGDRAAFDEHLPLLRSFGANPIHLGELGSGLVAKLVNNLLALCGVVAAAEGLMLGAAAGVDPAKLDEAIRASSGDSIAYRALADRALTGDYSPAFALDLAYKDIHLALELADEKSVPTPMGASVHNLMRMARGLGFGDDDPTSVMRVYETTLRHELSGGARPRD
jgi:3-hydroxyisobutyrate dehydrogenase-like beta-hydroxyacid dehydrogenase